MNVKKTVRFLAAAVLALCLTQLAAFADAPVAVQLDGAPVVFQDAEPQIVDQRTFLPFRAVFEAMGAEVSYGSGVVTATRDGRTVTMTIGSTEATVTQDGVSTPLTMDVAPFIDTNLNRTYVPVRFAAQAMGANVGWDPDARTVVIVDVEKQLDELLAGKSFTYMKKFLDRSKKFNQGVWDSEVQMSGTVAVDTALLDPESPISLTIPVSATAKGTTEDSAKVDMSMNVKMDLTALESLLEAAAAEEEDGEKTAAELNAALKGLAEQGIGASVRGDLSTGKFYVKVDESALGEMGDLTSELGVDLEKTWFLMDLRSMVEQTGVDYQEFLAQTLSLADELTLRDYIALLIAAEDVNDAGTAYADLYANMEKVLNSFCDSGFKQSGNVYTATYAVEAGSCAANVTLSLTMQGQAVVAYDCELSLNARDDALGQMTLGMKMKQDQQDKLSGKLSMNLLDQIKAELDFSGSYTKGNAAPATEPPAGVMIVDLMKLFESYGGSSVPAPLPVQEV